MKRLTYCILCLALCLAALVVSPRPAAAYCHEGCCERAQQDVESYCASMGSYVTYFYCEEGWNGSCCAVWFNCSPPPI